VGSIVSFAGILTTITCSYEHLITGSKRQFIPNSTLGGIISDEMGMGKSLTILSAIVGSLAAAELFARSGVRETVSQGVQKFTSKATLILVPSVCEWLLVISRAEMERGSKANFWNKM
jgi:hypothetical protein